MEEKMRALVANEPRVYREVVADALKQLRPLVEVHRAEPERLEREAERVRPHLIVCSRKLGSEVLGEEGRPICWAVLYPDGEDRLEVVEVGGDCAQEEEHLGGGVGVADLLRIVDQTELRRRSA